MVNGEVEADRRPWLGGVWALAPHLMLLVWMLWSAATADGDDRALSGMLVLLEIWLVPGGLTAAALMWRSDRFQGRTPWVIGGTVLGAAIMWIGAMSL
ncbi:hypothetical protein [Actinoplanes utahensis]|uniref:Uncharacterized protein n=1 Tax=Actinoplanes utahensis TaxID=1869 RepID=A0A0A6XF66_ACTUT|nr:hypothetical protein [Actinoplanes utahensis]KHD78737.1 hypothetical protein MB27_03700 [Actinoplanes utahensis]GIF32095.1 hypothetical protein Aut01nite_50810 [Actinoplanes utahensis]